jgi:hypothetical protein
MKLLVVIVNNRIADRTIDVLASLAPELASVTPARVLEPEHLPRDLAHSSVFAKGFHV